MGAMENNELPRATSCFPLNRRVRNALRSLHGGSVTFGRRRFFQSQGFSSKIRHLTRVQQFLNVLVPDEFEVDHR
jgi:hypothetical protein